MTSWRTINFHPVVLRKTRFAQDISWEPPRERKWTWDVHACSSLRPWSSRPTKFPSRRTRAFWLSWRIRCCLYFSARHAAFRCLRSWHSLSAYFFGESAKSIRTKLPLLRQISAPQPVLCLKMQKRDQILFRRERRSVHTIEFLEKVFQGTYMEDCSKVLLISRAKHWKQTACWSSFVCFSLLRSVRSMRYTCTLMVRDE